MRGMYVPKGSLGISTTGWSADLALFHLALALEWLLALGALRSLWLLHLHWLLHWLLLLTLLGLLLNTVGAILLEGVWLGLSWIKLVWERHVDYSEKFEELEGL